MARTARVAPGGLIYHVMNRAVARLPLFRKEADYAVFERVMLEAHERRPTRILAWCLMRTHWHFVIWPRKDGELTAFLRWLTHTHVMRWHAAHGTVGGGSLYQGRFKSFPVKRDEHVLTLCRHVERNAMTAGVVDRAERWRWGSLWARREGDDRLKSMLSAGPTDHPKNWMSLVNRPMSAKDRERIQTCIVRSRPFGDESWQMRTANRLGLTASIRSEGRPRTKTDGRRNAKN